MVQTMRDYFADKHVDRPWGYLDGDGRFIEVLILSQAQLGLKDRLAADLHAAGVTGRSLNLWRDLVQAIVNVVERHEATCTDAELSTIEETIGLATKIALFGGELSRRIPRLRKLLGRG